MAVMMTMMMTTMMMTTMMMMMMMMMMMPYPVLFDREGAKYRTADRRRDHVSSKL